MVFSDIPADLVSSINRDRACWLRPSRRGDPRGIARDQGIGEGVSKTGRGGGGTRVVGERLAEVLFKHS